MPLIWWPICSLVALVVCLGAYDVLQKRDTIPRNHIAGCLHNTGEGGISIHHLHGADLVLQLGTAYFGSRGDDGKFSMARLLETVAKYPQIRAIEIKLSQGAKPALGGLLPAAKVTREIAAARGIPKGVDCATPGTARPGWRRTTSGWCAGSTRP